MTIVAETARQVGAPKLRRPASEKAWPLIFLSLVHRTTSHGGVGVSASAWSSTKLELKEALRLCGDRKAGEEGRSVCEEEELEMRDWNRLSNGRNDGVGLRRPAREATDGRTLLPGEDIKEPLSRQLVLMPFVLTLDILAQTGSSRGQRSPTRPGCRLFAAQRPPSWHPWSSLRIPPRIARGWHRGGCEGPARSRRLILSHPNRTTAPRAEGHRRPHCRVGAGSSLRRQGSRRSPEAHLLCQTLRFGFHHIVPVSRRNRHELGELRAELGGGLVEGGVGRSLSVAFGTATVGGDRRGRDHDCLPGIGSEPPAASLMRGVRCAGQVVVSEAGAWRDPALQAVGGTCSCCGPGISRWGCKWALTTRDSPHFQAHAVTCFPCTVS